MTKPLYIFDLDETLIGADSSVLWNAFLVEKSLVTDPGFLAQDKYMMGLYAQGEMGMQEYLNFCMKPLLDIPVQQVTALVDECVQRDILPKQFIQAKALIKNLLSEQVDMLIISASTHFLVQPIARALGVEHAIGIDLKQHYGCYSAEIDGVASYREGKVQRLQQWLAEQEESYSSLHFYSDSINDLAMCEYADFTYLVNPCPRLQSLLPRPHWQHLSWNKENMSASA